MATFRLIGKEEERIYYLLNKLANGYPIDIESDLIQSIRETPEIDTRKIKQSIDISRSKEKPLGLRTFWVISKSGIGKSQALFRLSKEIQSISSNADDGKVASVLVDFSPPNDISGVAEVQLEIFKKCVLASSATKEHANKLAEEYIERSQVSKETVGTIVSLGLDIGLAVFNASLPTIGTFLGFFVGLIKDKYQKNFYEIKRKFKKNAEWREHPEATTLLIHWILYCYEPTDSRNKKLLTYAGQLADKGYLLKALMTILYKGRFRTFVIMLDELSLLGKKEISRILRMLRPENVENMDPEPSIIITASVLPEIEEIFNSDDPLKRRFWKHADKFRLRPPAVEKDNEAADDFRHCVDKVRKLVEKLTNAPKIDITNEQLNELRKKMNEQEELVTWQDLWVSVCELLAPWVRN